MTTTLEIKEVPPLRFPDASESWNRQRLGSLCDIKTGKKDVNEGNPDGAYPFFTCARKHTYSDYYSFDAEAILIAGNGDVGHCQRYKGKFEAYQRTYVLANFNVDVDYLFLYLNFRFRETVDQQKHMGAMPYIKLGMLTDFVVPFPSDPREGKKIADFLTAVDGRIGQLSQKKALLEDYKKGVMQQLFTQALRFKDDHGNDFPEWEEKTLGDVCSIVMGQSPASSSYNSEGIGLPLVQGNADIKERKTRPRAWTTEATKSCIKGDLILTVRAPVGAVAKSEHEACLGRGVAAIRNHKGAVQEFIYQWLLDQEPKWTRLEQGSTFTAVSGTDIRTLSISVPSNPEQTKIANFLTALDRKIESVSSQISHTQTFKKGLLQQMFV
jgi:restriction endonuclease S subunit